jgi:hypothetical protein
MLDGRRLKTMALMSIVVPVSILIAFRFGGILQEPLKITETITLDTIERSFERPYWAFDINETISSSFIRSDLSLNMSMLVHQYDDQACEYGGSDYQGIIITMNIFTLKGYVENVRLIFHESYEGALINLMPFDVRPKTQNLLAKDLPSMARNASLEFAGVNRPNVAFFWAPLHLVLQSPYNQSHQLDVISELVYFNGSAYKKVVQPFVVRLAPDSNNSFEEAEEISQETSFKSFLGGGDDQGDGKDFYKIYTNEGQRINVVVTSISNLGTKPDFSLHLYDPVRNIVVEKGPLNYFETIDIVANSTGFWFIEVRDHFNFGYYSMEVNQ